MISQTTSVPIPDILDPMLMMNRCASNAGLQILAEQINALGFAPAASAHALALAKAAATCIASASSQLQVRAQSDCSLRNALHS